MDAELSVLTFISYTHNPTTQRMRGEAQTVLVEQHRSTVLWLSNALRHFGVETVLDQYEEDNPPHSWPQWMEKNIKRCCWVLMICSESYHRHVTGQSRVDGGDEGRGSRFEGKTIYGLLTDDQHANKFIPVFLGEKNTSWLPTSLMGSHHYHIRLPEDLQSSPESALEDPEFKKLYARLTGQNRNPAPPVGDVVRLPAQNSTGAPPTGSLQTPTSSQGVTTGRRQLDHPSDEKPGGSHLNGSTVSRPFNPGTTKQDTAAVCRSQSIVLSLSLSSWI